MAAKKRSTSSSKTQPSFEERIEALGQVVRDLEEEELPLEASIERYREGVAHLKACRTLLDEAEQRLVELVQEDDGASERPLKVTEKGLAPDVEA